MGMVQRRDSLEENLSYRQARGGQDPLIPTGKEWEPSAPTKKSREENTKTHLRG